MSTHPSRHKSSLRVEQLEDRAVPAFGLAGGDSIAIGNIFPTTPVDQDEIVMGSGPGVAPLVRVFTSSGAQISAFTPYEAGFLGGVNVAIGDVNNDGVKDIIVTPGLGGGPVVKVFTPNGFQLASFFAYEPTFRGGLNVAAGNVDPNLPGDEIVTGAGVGGGPAVNTFNLAGQRVGSFFAYETTFRGGVNVAVGDLDPLRPGQEIVTGPGVGGGPIVKGFSSKGINLLNFVGFPQSTNFSGLTVAVGNTDVTPGDEIYVAQNVSPDQNPQISLFNRMGFFLQSVNPFPQGYTSTINMAVGNVVRGDPIGDLAVVTGENVVNQMPRFYIGLSGSPAPANGP